MRRWALTTMTVLALGTVAGCGGGATDGNTAIAPETGRPVATGAAPPVADYTAADQQYRDLQHGLNMPTGVVFPPHLPEHTGPYTTSTGLITAQNYWFCAWLWSYVDSAANAGRSSAAGDQLAKYVRMDAYTKGLDASGRSTVDGVLQAARTGGRKRVTAFTQGSCGGPFYGRARTVTGSP
jgi:hypothetical protein